jgi:hypothetical protein
VDGAPQAADEVALKDDGATHQVLIVLG